MSERMMSQDTYEAVERIQEAGSDLWQTIGRLYRQEHDAMPAPHYHVVSGMGGGYMPNANYYAATLTEARELLHERREEFLDDWHQDTNTRTVYGFPEEDFISYVDANDPYDLGEYAEIIPCTDDCDPDADY